MSTAASNPQNPYRSFLVDASAGTGKTYQLSHRFLHLVAAHSDPSKIIAVTFTIKAGQEMRERILSEANALLSSPEQAKDFDEQAKEFWKSLPGENNYTHPRSAKETAMCILESSSNLQIQTLDSLLGGWLRSYGRFSVVDAGEIGSEEQLTLLTTQASQELLRELDELKILEGISTSFPDKGIKDVLTRVLVCTKLGSPPLSEVGPKISNDLSLFNIELYKDGYGKFATPTGIKTTSSLPNELSTAKHASHFLTQKNTLKVTLFKSRGKPLDEAHPKFRSNLESWCRRALRYEQEQSLAAKHKLLTAVYGLFQKHLSQKKKEKGLWDFSDIEHEIWSLLSNQKHMGIQYYLLSQAQHILVDEFQDTSTRQWAALSPLVHELLSGQGVYENSSVFLVGDPKQSIYGFRGAQPELMTGGSLDDLGLERVQLTKSYRSSKGILDGANAVFASILGEDYPEHLASGSKPNQASIEQLSPPQNEKRNEKENKDETPLSEPERLASKIAAILGDPDYRIWDKERGGFRQVQPGDIAILLWAKTRGGEYIQSLESLEVPCEFWDGGDPLLELPEIKDLEQLLRLTIFPTDQLATWSVLSSPLFAVPAHRLAEASDILSEEKNTHKDEAQEQASSDTGALAEPTSFFAKLTETLAENGPLSETQTQRAQLITEYLKTASAAEETYNKLWTARSFWSLLQKLGWIACYQQTLLVEANELQSVQAAENARLFCGALFEAERKAGEPYEILDKLKSLRTQGISWLPKSNASPGMSKVKVMSIHKSKGLEFPIVCIPELGRDWVRPDQYWVRTTSTSKTGASGAPGLRYIGSKKENHFMQDDPDVAASISESNQEKARLLYVAWTRACQHLILSWEKESAFAGKIKAIDTQTPVFLRTTEENAKKFPPLIRTQEAQEEKQTKLKNLGASWSPSAQSKPLWIHSPSQAGTATNTKESDRESTENVSTAKTTSLDHARLAGIWLHHYFEQRLENTYSPASNRETRMSSGELWQWTLRTQEPRLWNWLALRAKHRSTFPWFPEDTPEKLARTFAVIRSDAEKTWEAGFWQDLLASAKNIHCERSLRAYQARRHKYVRGQCDLWVDLKPQDARQGIWKEKPFDCLIADFKSTHAIQAMDKKHRMVYAHDSGTAQQLLAYREIAAGARNPAKNDAIEAIGGFVIWSAAPEIDQIFP